MTRERKRQLSCCRQRSANIEQNCRQRHHERQSAPIPLLEGSLFGFWSEKRLGKRHFPKPKGIAMTASRHDVALRGECR